MFLFFSNRVGCLSSIIVSALATILLLFLFRARRRITRRRAASFKSLRYQIRKGPSGAGLIGALH